MKIIFLIGISLLALRTELFPQHSIWNTPYAYLGQKPPGDTPIVFAPRRLADSGYWNGGRVAFTGDGQQFIYGINTSWYNGEHQKLMCYRFEGGNWKGPILLFDHFDVPTFAMDGKTLYLSANGQGIYQTRFSDTGWTKPVEFLKRSYSLYNFMPTRSGQYYVGSNGTWGARSDFNSWKFAVLAGSGSDSSIRSLGEPLNSPGFNGDFYVAPDESYIIISTKESPSFESELYISFRKQDRSWSNPVSLGPLINQGAAHRWGAYVSPDHKYLFYTRGTSEKDCTIYWVRFDKLKKKLSAQQK